MNLVTLLTKQGDLSTMVPSRKEPCTDRSSKRVVDVVFSIPGGSISGKHSPPQHPARRAWSALRFSEAPATTSTRRWQAAHASSL
ncbi:MAG: hypothetical protein ACJAZN_001423, partial [Planctomycetota bacterium]